MKTIRVAIISLPLAMVLNLVAGCGKNPAIHQKTSESGMPSTSQPSSEEVLAAAKLQANELLAHPDKADEWLKTSLAELKDCMAKKRCGWSLKERNQYLHAAEEAVTSAHNIIKKLEAGIEDFSDVCDIIAQAAICVYNCGKSDAFTVNGCKKSYEELCNDVLGACKIIREMQPAANWAEEATWNIFNDDALFATISKLERLTESFIWHSENRPVNNLKAVYEEAGQILTSTKTNFRTKEGREAYAKKWVRISILLSGAIKDNFS